jgi:hypothetical protein
MARKRALIVAITLATLIVVGYFWWPSALEGLRDLHGPLGGGPAMHGGR